MPARYLAVAEIGPPCGLSGEVALIVLTDYPERLASGSVYRLSPPMPDRAELTLVEVRGSGKLRARFEGIEDAQTARGLTGRRLLVPSDEATPLEEGTFWVDDLLGAEVVEETGGRLGELVEVIRTGANDVYVVELDDGRELPLPAIKDVIREVDIGAGRIMVRLLPGLADLAGPPGGAGER